MISTQKNLLMRYDVQFSPLLALSPLDGRYQPKLTDLRSIASEYGLIRYRLIVEIRWLITLGRYAWFYSVAVAGC